MAGWYVDEGIAALTAEWKRAHPGATVYHIGDDAHSGNPDVSQHAPDRGGSRPGDDRGEVDAGDYMPGKGVTESDLNDLAEGLRRSRDKRIMYVIWGQRIFSSRVVDGVPAWTWRTYKGKKHGHVHVSANDEFDNDKSDWKWEKLAARVIPNVKVDGITVPQLQLGDEDSADDGYNTIARAQVLANWLENKTADLDPDGVYGPNTARKFAKIFGGDGRKLSTAQWRTLHGC